MENENLEEKAFPLCDTIEELLETSNEEIFSELKNGDRITKVAGMKDRIYVVDLENILNSPMFQPLKEKTYLDEIYNKINKIIFYPNNDETKGEFNLSDVLRSRKGDCVEKSALFQITMDLLKKKENHRFYGKKSFYVSGLISGLNDPIDLHAFNIITSKDGNFLVDVQNPLTIKGIKVPYIVPIRKMDDKKIVVPEEYRFNRAYSF